MADHMKIQNRAGFSLVEMLIVIAIIGLITLISLPIYQRVKPTINLDSKTRILVSDLRYAQQLAVTEQANHQVEFNQILNQYTIRNQATNEIIKTETINQSIRIESVNNLTDNTVVFNVTGAAVKDGSIVLINSNNATSTISIKPSGYVKIE